MNLKELLLNGCTIYHSYKENKEEWVGEAKFYVDAGYYYKAKIIFESSYGRKEWDIDQIDEAVQFFIEIIFNEKNLMYKRIEEPLIIKDITGKKENDELSEAYKL